ncbi:hypothetical protein [Streptosporangium sp. NPDC087985]|uniref:hypothetical protein n=1 Tax=Streptosporangium sp. NPDC087985 TaxID=3366196 RepID=UPI0038272726
MNFREQRARVPQPCAIRPFCGPRGRRHSPWVTLYRYFAAWRDEFGSFTNSPTRLPVDTTIKLPFLPAHGALSWGPRALWPLTVIALPAVAEAAGCALPPDIVAEYYTSSVLGLLN